MDQALNSQKTPHTSPLRASYGMSFVSILMKNDRVIKGFYCTCMMVIQVEYLLQWSITWKYFWHNMLVIKFYKLWTSEQYFQTSDFWRWFQFKIARPVTDVVIWMFSIQYCVILDSVIMGPHCINSSGGRFKNTYELLNLRALKFSYVNKIHIFQCMGKIFCVEFQRYPLKFHTKYLTHTLKDMIFMQFWNFKSS